MTKETMMTYNSWVSNMMDRSMDGMSNNRGLVSNRVSNRVGNSSSMVGWSSRVIFRVLRGSFIGDIGNISVIPVDVIVDVLDPGENFNIITTQTKLFIIQYLPSGRATE